jgi:tRNA-splicing ligase RtcB
MASGKGTLIEERSEEIPEVYKNLDQVVDIAHRAGISKKCGQSPRPRLH